MEGDNIKRERAWEKKLRDAEKVATDIQAKYIFMEKQAAKFHTDVRPATATVSTVIYVYLSLVFSQLVTTAGIRSRARVYCGIPSDHGGSDKCS